MAIRRQKHDNFWRILRDSNRVLVNALRRPFVITEIEKACSVDYGDGLNLTCKAPKCDCCKKKVNP